MDRKEAIKQATKLAKAPIENRDDAEQKHKELNQLFKQFHLFWNEINKEAERNGK
ncbi:hypothetical protein TEHD86_1787 [Tetragenococcus halophilus subsp. halophilus]|uniref:hypothetical protein n=1 Tax=Tetragenococcus halophilus TaxID=51669 RepID=UPI000CAAF4D2|nr:hypothetical protein [Tetragenococcus halophilus]GBD79440.1 hypothetical protein TEHD10_0503 [Tetragenococcus halophilus subsp. halophilus]GBD83065.1 hypothetical protein TEHD86_1787 [Tetragenococcus halophilus subsp. halophilus]